MHALLSIKPRYAEAIVNGDKKYEFRKSIFKKREIEKVYIYVTSPTKKIIGAFQIRKIIEAHPNNLWNELMNFSGLSQREFFGYFDGCEVGFAIEIENLERFEKPIDPWSLMPSFRPPQSFYYMDSNALSSLFFSSESPHTSHME